MSMQARIASGLTALGLTPPDGAAARLAEYGRLLLEQNQVMNLTAITEPDQVADLHFLDSAALLTLGEDLRGKRLIDVGTGAGFPGLPLRILEPSLQLTLLDSLGKRVNWLASAPAPTIRSWRRARLCRLSKPGRASKFPALRKSLGARATSRRSSS